MTARHRIGSAFRTLAHGSRPCDRLLMCVLPGILMLGWLLPASAATESVTVRLGAIQVDGDIRAEGYLDAMDDRPGDRSDRVDLGTRSVPRLEGSWRVSDRNRLHFDYFRYDPDHDYVLDHDIQSGGVTVPAGSHAHLGARVKLASLVYDRALVESEHVSLGAQAGIAWGAIAAGLRVTIAGAEADVGDRTSGFAPVLGLRLTTRSADARWRLVLQGQYVNANWGNLAHYNGDLTRANALIEYRFTPHFGWHLGYDSFRLDVRRDFGPVTAGMVLRFAGPTTGLTLAF